MSSMSEAGSMASVVASLSKSFSQVPPSAVPAMLDCIILTTGLSPRSLFDSLLNDFPRLLKVPLFFLLYQFLYALLTIYLNDFWFDFDFKPCQFTDLVIFVDCDRILSRKIRIWMVINISILCRWWAHFVTS